MGTCSDKSCTLSHKYEKSKMPVCHHFLLGSCLSNDCSFRHVKVNPNAPLCTEFIHGHCELGEDVSYLTLYSLLLTSI